MNVVNIKLHQKITSTNLEIANSYIQFDDKNPLDPIRLNLAPEKKIKGTLTSLVTYITSYKVTMLTCGVRCY